VTVDVCTCRDCTEYERRHGTLTKAVTADELRQDIGRLRSVLLMLEDGTRRKDWSASIVVPFESAERSVRKLRRVVERLVWLVSPDEVKVDIREGTGV